MKKISIPLLIFSFLLVTVITSCKRDEASLVDKKGPVSAEMQSKSRIAFAKVLTTLLQQKNIRQFIKTEALRKFGSDYDVFYPLIKNKPVENGPTFREHIAKAMEGSKYGITLEDIERNLPLLNILAPELSNFSAEKWNTEDQVPIVAVRNLEEMKKNNKLLAYDVAGNTTELDYFNDPGIPLLIIKDNESVEIRNNLNGYNTLKHHWVKEHPPVLETDGIQYYYSDEKLYENKPAAAHAEIDEVSFGGRPTGVQTLGCSRAIFFGYFDPLVQQAYIKNIYNPSCPENVATVRDFVYYGIDPTIPINSGPLKYNYREYITSIRCEDLNGRSRYDDLGEGTILDFDITVYTADADPIFPLKKRLAVDKTSFFRTSPPLNPTPQAIDLTAYPNSPLEIAVWNFKRQGDVWKYAIFEYDPSTITTESRTISANLGTNFSIGDEKVGGKFGLSASVSASRTVTFSYTNTSDDLGETLSYWCDPVIKERFTIPSGSFGVCGWGSGRPFRTNTDAGRSYDIGTGYIAISVEPRAQN